MTNPFEKRASEYFQDESSFLAVISPEPISLYLAPLARAGRLYDRLVLMHGAPGSGKTTMAQVFEYQRIAMMLRHVTHHKQLIATLADCRAIEDRRPALVGCRLPLESGYRDIWQFPYSQEVRTALLTTLIQARAVLAWLRNLGSGGVPVDAVTLVPRAGTSAAIDAIGGLAGRDVLQRAQAVERELYDIAAALVPPPVAALEGSDLGTYRPFDVLDYLEFPPAATEPRVRALPLVVLDDVQTLHPAQWSRLQAWLARREPNVARWALSWVDVVSPEEVFNAGKESTFSLPDQPGVTSGRDVTRIFLQGARTKHGKARRAFRRTAKDMAQRYLAQMPGLYGRGVSSFEALLSTSVGAFPPGKFREFERGVNRDLAERAVSPAARTRIEHLVDRYIRSSKSHDLPPEVRLAMVRILGARYAKRLDRQQPLFVGSPAPNDQGVADDLRVTAGVAEGARLHLLHSHDRPYYFGMDDLCDMSSENVEQFLLLANTLVERAMTQLTRGRDATLATSTQQHDLRQAARNLFSHWSFPEHQAVARMIETIAALCQARSLEANAPLGAGANAVGVPQEDFDQLSGSHERLSRILLYAAAYNAVTIVSEYECKKKKWCLLELGGIPILKFGLTLKRGGFLESTVNELARMAGAADEQASGHPRTPPALSLGEAT